jgi:FkbM family methyltransferase
MGAMQTAARRLRSAILHPGWAVSESLARVRKITVPRTGVLRGSIGQICFDFDFGLSPYVRDMYAGGYEADIVQLLRRLLKKGGVYVDVGANIGYLSAVAAGCVGTQGTILSIEPAPRYFDQLARLRDLNPEYRWQVVNAGIGSEPGAATLTLSTKNIGWNSFVQGQIPRELVDSEVTVPVMRLDDCLKAAELKRADVVKIDVEGYEANVLIGAKPLLEAGVIDHLIVELLPGQYAAQGMDFMQVMDMVTGCGYEALEPRRPHRAVAFADVTNGDNVWFRRAGCLTPADASRTGR